MKLIKRSLPFLLALCMMFGSYSLTASATETTTESVILNVGDTYTLTTSTDSAITYTDDGIVSVTTDITLHDHVSNTAYSLESFSDSVSTATLSQAEFTLQEAEIADSYYVYNEYAKVYLTDNQIASTFFSSNKANRIVFTPVENSDGTVSYRICKGNGNRYIMFYAQEMNFNSTTDY